MRKVISWASLLLGLLIGGFSFFAYWGYSLKYPDQIPSEVEFMVLGLTFSIVLLIVHQIEEADKS